MHQIPIYTMVRAKYGHSIDVNLYDVDIDEDECTHYEIQHRSKKAYVTAENTDIARQIFIERRLDNMSFNPSEIKIKEVDYVNLSKNDSPSYHHTQFDTTDTKMKCNMMGTHQSEYTLVNQRICHRK